VIIGHDSRPERWTISKRQCPKHHRQKHCQRGANNSGILAGGLVGPGIRAHNGIGCGQHVMVAVGDAKRTVNSTLRGLVASKLERSLVVRDGKVNGGALQLWGRAACAGNGSSMPMP